MHDTTQNGGGGGSDSDSDSGAGGGGQPFSRFRKTNGTKHTAVFLFLLHKSRHHAPFYAKDVSFYQDRLGTHMRMASEKNHFLAGGEGSSPPDEQEKGARQVLTLPGLACPALPCPAYCLSTCIPASGCLSG